MKNTLDVIHSRLNEADDQISYFKDQVAKSILFEKLKEKGI